MKQNATKMSWSNGRLGHKYLSNASFCIVLHHFFDFSRCTDGIATTSARAASALPRVG